LKVQELGDTPCSFNFRANLITGRTFSALRPAGGVFSSIRALSQDK
jgi:hypothetical protein